MIPFLFLSQAETVRQKRSATIALAAFSALALAALEFVLSIAARDQVLTPLAMYLVPIAAIAGSAMLILFGIQPKAPDFLIVYSEKIADGFRGIFRRRPRRPHPAARPMAAPNDRKNTWTILRAAVRRAGHRHISFLLLLVFVITYLEFFTRTLGAEDFNPTKVFLLTLYRVPSICEDILPFTTLFGSIAAFVLANRRLEVVIARAAGISAWQFLLPACIVGLLVGIVATTVYNPISTELRAVSDQIRASLTEKRSSRPSGPVWIRQAAEGRESIIGALKTSDDGMTLTDVTAFVFDENGAIPRAGDAERPTTRPASGKSTMRSSRGSRSSRGRRNSYRLPTTLSPGQVRETFDSLDATSFWELPALIDTARRAGLPSSRYELRYNTLLSRPIVLLAMVLIAAIVSLRFSRSREVGNMILAGVGVGFMLYVVSKIAWDLGSGGMCRHRLPHGSRRSYGTYWSDCAPAPGGWMSVGGDVRTLIIGRCAVPLFRWPRFRLSSFRLPRPPRRPVPHDGRLRRREAETRLADARQGGGARLRLRQRHHFSVGNVKIYYIGYTLEADRVSYDQSTGKLIATGNVKLTIRRAHRLRRGDRHHRGFPRRLGRFAARRNSGQDPFRRNER